MVRSSEHNDRVVFGLPQVTHDDAALAAGCFDHLSIADIDTDVVDLLPTVAALAFFINPKDEIAGFKFRPCNKQSSVVTVFRLTCGVGVHVITEFRINLMDCPICETGTVELRAAFRTPYIGTAELC